MTSNFYTYLVLPKHFDYKKLEAKLPQVIEKYVGPQLEKGMGVSLAEFRKKGNDIGLYLQPLTSIHLHSNATVELSPPGDIQYVYIFGAVAVFMLLIACINFMNLSTAGASKRAREVGIRKVLGSVKSELIRQFMTESIVMTAFALVLSILIVYLAMPLFNQLAGQHLQLRLFEHPATLITLISLGLLTGIIAGSYPAFYLSSFNPITVLKGKFSTGKGSAGLRSGLVVFQFFISILLIVGTVVVYSQLSFIQHKKLGYDKDQVMIIESWHLGKNENAFTQQLLKDPRIANISNSGYVPAGYSFDNNFFVYPGSSSNQMVKALRYDVDYNYIPTLGISVKEGRNFSKDFGSDSSGAILNESAAAALGWKNNALGQVITRPDNDGSKATYTVVGVIKDFHFKSLHELISPLIMILSKQSSGNMIVKIKTKDIPGLVKTMQKDWASFGPDAPLSYTFLDERFNNTYRAEQKVGQILGIFAGLTIFVACLGLFGLARFTAEQRTKEIGIRKVLGASVSGIVHLLSKEFLKLVLIAFIVASPIAWYAMHLWLQDFAYRINIGWWVFALAALLAVIISLATISLQAVKAAVANPVKSLHAE
jgi:putative ABC transport system permease protein